MLSKRQACPGQREERSYLEQREAEAAALVTSLLFSRLAEKHVSSPGLPAPHPAPGPLQRLAAKLPGELFLAGMVFPIVHLVRGSQMRNVSAENKYHVSPEPQEGSWERPDEMPPVPDTLRPAAIGSFLPR